MFSHLEHYLSLLAHARQAEWNEGAAHGLRKATNRAAAEHRDQLPPRSMAPPGRLPLNRSSSSTPALTR